MPKKVNSKVFFNASVILAGLASPGGGSAKLLGWGQQKRFRGIISEIIADEVMRRASKLGIGTAQASTMLYRGFAVVMPPPTVDLVDRYKAMVIDHGDAHVLASAWASKSDFLVSLDKKHILSLKKKIKTVKIVSPGELIEILSR